MKHSVAGIVYSDSLFFIARRLPVGDMGSRWEFPGGKVEENETFQQALVREYMEEFGVPVTVGSLIAETEFFHKEKPVALHAYEVIFPEDNYSWVLSEHTDVKWASLEEIEMLPFVDSDSLLIPEIKKWLKKQH